MRTEHVKYLACLTCRGPLKVRADEVDIDRVRTGSLLGRCGKTYPIVNFIPRFVDRNNYSGNFGFQWNKHFRTQCDSYSGQPISETRFFSETRWGRDLEGQVVLEAGCGSGRFTEQAVTTKAMVVSFDYSSAVDANYRNNGHFENLLIVQADIFNMPFREGPFDKVFCLGVIQHTPDPSRAFTCLAKMLGPGGSIVIDAYRIWPWWKQALMSKYYVRPLASRVPNELLYKLCERWVDMLWPATGLFHRLTGRRALSWFLLMADYRGVFDLPESVLKEWSVLDTFDMLSPVYDCPQTIPSVKKWFSDAGLGGVEVGYGYNGIVGRGRKR